MLKGFLKSTTTIIEHNQSTFCFLSMYKLGKIYGTLINFLPSFLQLVLASMLRIDIGRMFNSSLISHLMHWQPSSRNHTKIPFVHSKVSIQDLAGIPLAASTTNTKTKAKHLNAFNVLSRGHSLYSRAKPNSKYKPVVILPLQTSTALTTSLTRNKKLNNMHILNTDSEATISDCSTNNNGIGFSSWRIGALYSETIMLNQPNSPHFTDYIGMDLSGFLQSSSSSVILALTVAETLRKFNESGKAVEFIGKEIRWLSLQDRFIVSGLLLEYGASVGYFGFNIKVFKYILSTGKGKDIPLVLALAKTIKAQGLFGSPERNDILCSKYLS